MSRRKRRHPKRQSKKNYGSARPSTPRPRPSTPRSQPDDAEVEPMAVEWCVANLEDAMKDLGNDLVALAGMGAPLEALEKVKKWGDRLLAAWSALTREQRETAMVFHRLDGMDLLDAVMAAAII